MNVKTYSYNARRSALRQSALLFAPLVALTGLMAACSQQPEVAGPHQPEDVLVAQTTFLMERLDNWEAPASPTEVDAFVATAEAAWAKEARKRYPDYERLLSPLYGALLASKLYTGSFTPEQWQRQGRLMCYALGKYTLSLVAGEFAYLKSEPNEAKAQWLAGTASTLSDQCSFSDEQQTLVDSLRRQYPAVIDAYLNSAALQDSMATLFLTEALSDVMDTIGEMYLRDVPDGFGDEVRDPEAYGLDTEQCAALLRQQASPSEAQFVRVHLVEEQPSSTSIAMTLEKSGERLALQNEVLFDLSGVKRSPPVYQDAYGNYTTYAEFTDEGAACLHNLTQANVGKRLGIVVDGQLVRAPRLLAPLPAGEFPILETTSQTRAQRLAKEINEKV